MGSGECSRWKYGLGAICLTLALAGCLQAQPQGQAVRSLNGSATNLTLVGGTVITDNTGANFWEITNTINGPDHDLIFQNATQGPLGLVGNRELASTFSSNIFSGSIFASGTPGIFASAIPGPGYLGNYSQANSWNSFQAVNLGNPYPWNQWFTASVNGGGDGTTNITQKFGWNVSNTGSPVKTDIGTMFVLMEGNEADVDTNHLSTFIVQTVFPDASSEIPLNITSYIRPGDPLYKKSVFQSQFDNWQMAYDLLPSTNLFLAQLSKGFVTLDYSVDGKTFYSSPGQHTIFEMSNACDLTYFDNGPGIFMLFHNNPGNAPTFWLTANAIEQIEGGLCVGTNANPNGLNPTNQVSISSPFKKDSLDVATNGNTYVNGVLFISNPSGGIFSIWVTNGQPSNAQLGGNGSSALLISNNIPALIFATNNTVTSGRILTATP